MTAPRVVAIIQARMGSTRLPGKTLADLGGAPVMDRVLARVARADRVADVVVAITDRPVDDQLEDHLVALGAKVVRGDSDDVLARFGLVAEMHPADAYVRITADCPLIDPGVIDDVVAAFAQGDVDYCSNVLARTYPIGMDCEVISSGALRTALDEAADPAEREHVTPFLYRHPERFRLRNVEAPAWAARPHLRLTVDEPNDVELLRHIVAELGPDASLREILELLDTRPDIAAINADVEHRHVEKPTSW
jgi:spore coat polysaccharide biosynthesis protein SpsF